MAKFKNKFSVTGNRSLLKAYSEEITLLGYEPCFTINPVEDYLKVYEIGKWQYNTHDGSVDVYTLPQDWNEALRLAGEKEEESYKVGDWVYWSGNNPRVGQIIGKCASFNDSWQVSKVGTSCSEKHLRKSTPEEIEKFLIGEAEKKGFVKGAKIINHNERKVTLEKLNVMHGEEGPYLVTIDSDNCSSYLESCKLIPSHPQIEINGYKAEFKDWGLDFNNGCAKIDKALFIEMHNVFTKPIYRNTNKFVKSVTIGVGTFTTAQITEIAEYYQGGKP